MEVDGQLTKMYDVSPIGREALIGEDKQGLLSGDQVSPVEKENKEQFGLMLQLDIVFEQFGEIFDWENIKESLIFEDTVEEIHKDSWFTFHKDKPPKTIFHELDSNIDLAWTTNEFDVDVRGKIHHQLRPPEVVDDQLRFEQELPHEAHQVVSFPTLKHESFEKKKFDYGNSEKNNLYLD